MPRLISVADAILGRPLAAQAGTATPSARELARTPIRVVVVSMDTHLSSAFGRVRAQLAREFPGLTLSQHAAAEYAGNDAAIARCRADIASSSVAAVATSSTSCRRSFHAAASCVRRLINPMRPPRD